SEAGGGAGAAGVEVLGAEHGHRPPEVVVVELLAGAAGVDLHRRDAEAEVVVGRAHVAEGEVGGLRAVRVRGGVVLVGGGVPLGRGGGGQVAAGVVAGGR